MRFPVTVSVRPCYGRTWEAFASAGTPWVRKSALVPIVGFTDSDAYARFCEYVRERWPEHAFSFRRAVP